MFSNKPALKIIVVFIMAYLFTACDGESDGVPKPLFDTGSGFSGSVHSIVEANDDSGDIYASGIFADFRGNARNRIARLTVMAPTILDLLLPKDLISPFTVSL